MAKGNREKIKLVSSAGTGHYYTAQKNKKLHPEKLETKKSKRKPCWIMCLMQDCGWFL